MKGIGRQLIGMYGREELTLCCLGSRMFLFASKRERIYMAWPRQRKRWTDQSRASFSERRYRRLRPGVLVWVIAYSARIEDRAGDFGGVYMAVLLTMVGKMPGWSIGR